jgi:hypothetical protein
METFFWAGVFSLDSALQATSVRAAAKTNIARAANFFIISPLPFRVKM